MCQDIVKVGKRHARRGAEKIPKGKARADSFWGSRSPSHPKGVPAPLTSGSTETIPESRLGSASLLCFSKERTRTDQAATPGSPETALSDHPLWGERPSLWTWEVKASREGSRSPRVRKVKEFQYHRLLSYPGRNEKSSLLNHKAIKKLKIS